MTAMAEPTPSPSYGDPLSANVPHTMQELWAGLDMRAEPLDVEILKEWEEDGIVLKVLRYRVGIFKGQKAMMGAVYGYPKGGSKLPALVQIHGGGQYADYKAALTNAKRGYATISIAWAGRISAPNYKVDPDVVKLFWEGKTTIRTTNSPPTGARSMPTMPHAEMRQTISSASSRARGRWIQ